jgi:hypothetical protein
MDQDRKKPRPEALHREGLFPVVDPGSINKTISS